MKPSSFSPKYEGFNAEEYFTNKRFFAGIYDNESHLQLILPEEEIYIFSTEDFLVIGRPGVDGIEFGFRKNQEGIWAYYPIDQRFSLVAANIAELVRGWYAGNVAI